MTERFDPNSIKGYRLRYPQGVSLSDQHGTVRSVSRPGRYVVIFYPGPTAPGDPIPDGWPAPGCGAQSCNVDTMMVESGKTADQVFAICTKPVADINRFAREKGLNRLLILSDPGHLASPIYGVPTWTYAGQVYYQRVTVVVQDHVIIGAWTPTSARDDFVKIAEALALP